ncbi:hypothetical protein POM88_053284 [Heracleum sosnowskyi]|uniref:Uncharacterized protein n=1 Tax=Heracleum sosnowskyi TaxID=360622 RepID=A0AAD8GQF9_9APIA|nr:hypothetical protein POM88_053284 [Heracleum sosnowskyi]
MGSQIALLQRQWRYCGFGWPDSEITINDVANDGFLSHVSMKMGTVLFKPDLKGPFAYTGAYNVKIPGGKKVLEAQPRTDGKFWNLKRTKENVAAHPELKPTLG